MSKLGKKLFIVFLVLVVFSLFLAGLFINFSIGRSFDNFINLQRQEKVEHLSSVLTEHLEENNFESLSSIIENFSRTNKIPIWLENESGNLSYFSTQSNHMSAMMNRMGRMGMHRSNHMNMLPSPDDFPGPTRTEEIKTDQDSFKLYWKEINPGNQLESNLYDYFRGNIFRAIIFSALIAVLVTMIFSFILSNRITKPLLKLKNAALEVAQGRYEQNINSKGDDELTELIKAFNTMSNRLAKLEKIRKESASDLAHELRTPLTTIKGYLEAIEDGKLDADPESIREMQEETARMTHLVENLNDFANAQNKVFNLKKEKLNLNKIIKKVIRQQQESISSKDIDLKLEIDAQIYLKADQDSLIQILNNVLENAVKYNQENGFIKIKAKLKKDRVEIEIKDNGQGIKEADLPYIFERFYRADKSRNSENQGSGIGLAVVKELMDAHQGSVEVESSQKGSLFRLIFPD